MKTLNYFRLAIVLVAMALTYLVSSCGTNKELKQEIKAELFYKKHPEKIAQKCAELFEKLDSVGKATLDSVRQADNQNYANTLDSIANASQELLNSLKNDTTKAATYYKGKINELNTKIKDLKDSYKPCEPEKEYYSVIKWKDNTAALEAQRLQLLAKDKEIAKLQGIIEAQNKEIAEGDKEIRNLKWVITALLLGAIGWFFLRRVNLKSLIGL